MKKRRMDNLMTPSEEGYRTWEVKPHWRGQHKVYAAVLDESRGYLLHLLLRLTTHLPDVHA